VGEIKDAAVLELDGKYVTLGLVDMHSHRLVGPWPVILETEDSNKMNSRGFGPLTPFVRLLDFIHAYDFEIIIIASGGVTYFSQ